MEIAIKLLTVLGLGAVELWVAIPTGFVLKLHPVLVGSTAAVVSESERSQGYGYQLFEWLIKFPRIIANSYIWILVCNVVMPIAFICNGG
jgi:hypothetical protein